jgi:hypothetical protein
MGTVGKIYANGVAVAFMTAKLNAGNDGVANWQRAAG